MVGSDFAHAMAGGLGRLLRPERQLLMQVLGEGDLLVEDIVGPEQDDDEASPASRMAHSMSGGLSSLLRPDRQLLLRVIDATPLTVDDILAVPRAEGLPD